MDDSHIVVTGSYTRIQYPQGTQANPYFILAGNGPTRLNPAVRPNQVQKKQFYDAMREAERKTGRTFTPAEQRAFHEELAETGAASEEELTFGEIVEIGVEVLLGLL